MIKQSQFYTRDRAKPDNMPGSTLVRRKCIRCQQYQPMSGSTRIDGKFICSDCKDPTPK